jgi:hypothetical protein
MLLRNGKDYNVVCDSDMTDYCNYCMGKEEWDPSDTQICWTCLEEWYSSCLDVWDSYGTNRPKWGSRLFKKDVAYFRKKVKDMGL